jgi:Rrf2 family nitric oxide-sensitive transcriptional repressor
MHMTLHSDYALRMLMFLAVREPRANTVNDSPKATAYRATISSKVTLNLKSLGLVHRPGPFRRHPAGARA